MAVVIVESTVIALFKNWKNVILHTESKGLLHFLPKCYQGAQKGHRTCLFFSSSGTQECHLANSKTTIYTIYSG